MRLLVSVRSAAEVESALAGGADIIDAKEPNRGSLGAVAPETLAEILARVPSGYPVSVALGDVTTDPEVDAAVPALESTGRAFPIFLKLGFAGVLSPDTVSRLIGRAVALAAKQSPAPRIVAVAYADSARAETIPPELVIGAAHRAGAAGVLLDTFTKDGQGLLRWLSPGRLTDWVSAGRESGLTTAVAGELRLADLDVVREADPDVVGVRGAACEGGRGGRVTAGRVRALYLRIGSGLSAAVRP